ncbi:TetR/AcrR family transcriptional regulator [Clostridium sp. CX1]|uniref:TetR/AcrR family transcriptional regulator n=1 Tax=Clostridium sp. CX1 TaxID=2978346 RepID=UPI0021C1F2A7|nr:TetR/AcrR family transcriptional regulator [Clostridium sp. CX1]MCT8977846.1 TetR/AcrR family transcriptional regulator [Clostridium sp. CX1]
MQYLKEDVKEKILQSGLKEFKEKGYLDASVRNIAQNAGVSVGSVYKYFQNKECLFNTIVEPVYDKLMNYVLNLGKVDTSYQDPIWELTNIKNKIIDIFKDNSTELLILMDKSKGTKYHDIKEDLILHVHGILKDQLVQQLKSKGIILKYKDITYILAATLVDGVCMILRNNDDGMKISYLIQQLINIYFDDIEKRIL